MDDFRWLPPTAAERLQGRESIESHPVAPADFSLTLHQECPNLGPRWPGGRPGLYLSTSLASDPGRAGRSSANNARRPLPPSGRSSSMQRQATRSCIGRKLRTRSDEESSHPRRDPSHVGKDRSSRRTKGAKLAGKAGCAADWLRASVGTTTGRLRTEFRTRGRD